jgi:hypothetical protein
MEVPKLIHDSEDQFPKREKDIYPVKKSSSFEQSKLMRTPEAEPREFVYVYNYRENRTRRMKKRELLEKLGTSINILNLFFIPHDGGICVQSHQSTNNTNNSRRSKLRPSKDSILDRQHPDLYGQ